MKKKMILGLCVMTLLLSGCGVAKLKNGEEVVASLTGENITADDLYNKIKDKYARDILIDMIDTTILDSVYKTDDTMISTIKQQVSYYKEQLGDNFLSTIKTNLGLNSEDELYNYLMLSYKRNLATQDYVKKQLTESEINTYYENKTVGDVYVSHILIKPETTSTMTDDQIAAAEKVAKEKAQSLIAQLDKGADFATLAKANSQDTGSAANGGVIGWINKNDATYSQYFRDGAYELKKGKYSSTPVKSEYGYHIIIVTDTKAKPTLKDATDDIKTQLAAEKTTADTTLTYTALIALRTEHKLNIQDSTLKDEYNAYMKELTTKTTAQ